MDYRLLGRTGVRVSPLCFGAMMLGSWGNSDHDEGVRMIHAALDAGINFLDTADVYSGGESEEIVGKALAGGRRADVVLATKANGVMGTDPNRRGNSRRWLSLEVENSLRRLGTDYIDLYQIHRPDPDTDLDETLGALTDLQRAGKILYAGCSTFPAAQIMRSHWVSQRQGLIKFSTEQPPYSMLERTIENDVLPVTQQLGMGTLIWGPLAGGWLSGGYRAGSDLPVSSRAGRLPARYDMSRPENQHKLAVVEQLARAGRTGRPYPDPAGAGVCHHASGCHQRDHRSAHTRAPAITPGGRRHGLDRRRSRPDRRHRGAGRRCDGFGELSGRAPERPGQPGDAAGEPAAAELHRRPGNRWAIVGRQGVPAGLEQLIDAPPQPANLADSQELVQSLTERAIELPP